MGLVGIVKNGAAQFCEGVKKVEYSALAKKVAVIAVSTFAVAGVAVFLGVVSTPIAFAVGGSSAVLTQIFTSLFGNSPLDTKKTPEQPPQNSLPRVSSEPTVLLNREEAVREEAPRRGCFGF